MMKKPAQSVKSKQYDTAFASESLPTPEEHRLMLASGLDPSSGAAVREFRRHFRQMAAEGKTAGL